MAEDLSLVKYDVVNNNMSHYQSQGLKKGSSQHTRIEAYCDTFSPETTDIDEYFNFNILLLSGI